MPEVHNLPPDNKGRWENADHKDRRGIRKVFQTAKRVKARGVELAKGFDAAESAKVAVKAGERLAKRDVKPPVKGDRRGFDK